MSGAPPFPDDELRALARRVKSQLRARMRATRRALPPAAVAARSARVVHHLEALDELRAARAVALFWPIEGRGEVDLRPLDAELMRRGVARYYPFMEAVAPGNYTTGFRRVERPDDLELSGHGFYQPSRGPSAQRGDIDLVLVPALAVTPRGHRLGYGKGFYDATLGDVCPPARSVVVAFSFQILEEIPSEGHDFRCDRVVTDQGVCTANGSAEG